MKHISLSFDDKTFYEFKEYKSKKEKELKADITWEDYFKLLFEMRKQ